MRERKRKQRTGKRGEESGSKRVDPIAKRSMKWRNKGAEIGMPAPPTDPSSFDCNAATVYSAVEKLQPGVAGNTPR